MAETRALDVILVVAVLVKWWLSWFRPARHLCYFCYFFDPPFDFPSHREIAAHGRAAGHRAAYAACFATFATFSIRPLIFLGNHPISVCYFSTGDENFPPSKRSDGNWRAST